MVERIEIYRAPAANLDAQGMAGTINIILKKALDRKSLRVNASIGRVEEQGTVYDTYLQLYYGGQLIKPGANNHLKLNGMPAPKGSTMIFIMFSVFTVR